MTAPAGDVLSRHGLVSGWERFHAGEGMAVCDLSLKHDTRVQARPHLMEWSVELPPLPRDAGGDESGEGRHLMLSEMTGRVAEVVSKTCGGVLMGAVETHQRWRGIFATTATEPPTKAALRPILGEQFMEAGALRNVRRRLRGEQHEGKLPWAWQVKRGAAKRTYASDLYPGLHGQHEILTRHVVSAISRDLPMEERVLPRVVHHTMWMPSLDMARRAGIAMAEDGFASDVKSRDDDALPAKLLMSRPTLLSLEAMLPFIWNFCDLCEGVGGEYRGWGVYVAPPEGSGEGSAAASS